MKYEERSADRVHPSSLRYRNASLISSATEILFALGLEDSIVAVSHECDYPPPALEKPRVTRSHVNTAATSSQIDQQVRTLAKSSTALYEIDVDLLAALRPDLIVTQAQCDVCAVRVCRRARCRGRPARTIGHAGDRSQSAVARRRAGRHPDPGHCDRQRIASGSIYRRAASPHRCGPGGHRRSAPDECPRVALVEWLDPLMLSGNWMPQMVALAGGRHDLTRAGDHSPYVSWDVLAAYDPQVMLVMPCGFDLERTLAEWPILERQPGWRKLSAVRSGRVWAVDGNAYFNRSGPRLLDSLEILGHLLHPDRLGPPPHLVSSRAGAGWGRLIVVQTAGSGGPDFQSGPPASHEISWAAVTVRLQLFSLAPPVN